MYEGFYRCKRCNKLKNVPQHIGPEICGSCGAVMVWVKEELYNNEKYISKFETEIDYGEKHSKENW